MPYHGLGSGIKRALEEWPNIDFSDDREGCLFTAIVHRKEIEEVVEAAVSSKTPGISSGKSSGKTEDQILDFLSDRPKMTIPELAEEIGITTRGVEKQIMNLRREGRLRRIGPAKGGYWEVIKKDKG